MGGGVPGPAPVGRQHVPDLQRAAGPVLRTPRGGTGRRARSSARAARGRTGPRAGPVAQDVAGSRRHRAGRLPRVRLRQRDPLLARRARSRRGAAGTARRSPQRARVRRAAGGCRARPDAAAHRRGPGRHGRGTDACGRPGRRVRVGAGGLGAAHVAAGALRDGVRPRSRPPRRDGGPGDARRPAGGAGRRVGGAAPGLRPLSARDLSRVPSRLHSRPRHVDLFFSR